MRRQPRLRIRPFAALALLCLAAAITAGGIEQAANAQVFTEPKQKSRARKPPRQVRRAPATVAPPEVPGARTHVAEESSPRRFGDPAGYCAAVGTAEQADGRYTGPPLPQWLSRLAQSPPKGGAPGAMVWRCSKARVFVCQDQSGKGDCTRPSQDREPTAEMRSYCSANRNAAIPYSVRGNTAPVWVCRKGAPSISGEQPGIDADGYVAGYWRDVTEFAPGNMVGAVPRSMLGTWTTTVKVPLLFIQTPFDASVNIVGGSMNDVIARVEYFTTAANGVYTKVCTSNLVLRSTAAGALVADERLTAILPSAPCPNLGTITMTPRNGQIFMEWRKADKSKVQRSGWAARR